jgi:hypothetical protein
MFAVAGVGVHDSPISPRFLVRPAHTPLTEPDVWEYNLWCGRVSHSRKRRSRREQCRMGRKSACIHSVYITREPVERSALSRHADAPKEGGRGFPCLGFDDAVLGRQVPELCDVYRSY